MQRCIYFFVCWVFVKNITTISYVGCKKMSICKSNLRTADGANSQIDSLFMLKYKYLSIVFLGDVARCFVQQQLQEKKSLLV